MLCRVRRAAAAGDHRRADGRPAGLGAAAHPPVRHLRLRPRRAVRARPACYFSGVVSMPFVPGHEVVAELLDDCEDLPAGTRVVIDPVLTCAARGVEPCDGCATGATNRCSRITVGHLAPGLQTGFCADTGGGWGEVLTAHRSQLHAVPEGYSDEQAVLTEPMACAVHTALRAGVRRQRPGAGQRRRLGRPAHDAGPAQPHRRRRDHRRRQARPPARAGPPARRHRGGRAGRGAAPAAPGHRCVPDQARAAPRRTCSAASTSPSTRSAASSRSRPRCTPPAPAAGWCCPGCRRRPTCPRRGSASWRWSAPTRPPSASRRSAAGARSTSRVELLAGDAVGQLAKTRRQLPAAPLARGARPRARRRPARYGQGGVRSRAR